MDIKQKFEYCFLYYCNVYLCETASQMRITVGWDLTLSYGNRLDCCRLLIWNINFFQ